jgi:hypothetical protein
MSRFASWAEIGRRMVSFHAIIIAEGPAYRRGILPFIIGFGALMPALGF